MERDQVIAIANEVYGKGTPWTGIQLQRLLLLAEKFASAEREQCATLVDANADGCTGLMEQVLRSNAAAIRARGQA